MLYLWEPGVRTTLEGRALSQKSMLMVEKGTLTNTQVMDCFTKYSVNFVDANYWLDSMSLSEMSG